MTYAFINEFTVTTWGRDHWRARSSEKMVEFDAPRETPMMDLYRLGKEALLAAS